MINQLIIKIKSYRTLFTSNHRISAANFSVFFRQFATLISASIPLLHCFDILEKSQTETHLCNLIIAIKKELLTGTNLSSCLQLYPRYFDSLTCQLIYISEQTGNLDTMLNRVANYQEAKLAFQKRIKQALFYPCLITITALAVTFIMLIFIIPKFADLFSTSQTQLPLLTSIIFYIALKLQQCIVLFIAFITAIGIFLFRNWQKPNVKYYRQLFLKKLPFINHYQQKIILARFNRQFAIAFSAGIPILAALELASTVCKTEEFSQLLRVLSTEINSGSQIHQAMQSLVFFPAFMTQMIKIGEESGTLDHMLNKIADFFEAEIDQLLNRINQLLEPLIILILGVLIGGLVVGMYLPLFKLGSVL